MNFKKIAFEASQMEFKGQGTMGTAKWNKFALNMWQAENKVLTADQEAEVLKLM